MRASITGPSATAPSFDLFEHAEMGLSPSKIAIEKLSIASESASREGRKDIQCILSDNDFIDNLRELWQQIPLTSQNRIAFSRQRKTILSSHISPQAKRSVAFMPPNYKKRSRTGRWNIYKKRNSQKSEHTAYKTRKRRTLLQTYGRRQREELVDCSGPKRNPSSRKGSQVSQKLEIDSSELRQLVEKIGYWKSNISSYFFEEEEVSEHVLNDAIVGSYRLMRHLEQRERRDEVRIRLLKIMFHRLLEKVCNQYARPKDLERITRIISISGLPNEDSEGIGKRINDWGKIGRRLDMLCKDISDGHVRNEHLGIIFRLPKNMSDNYLTKLPYKGPRRRQEIRKFQKNGLGSKEKFREVDMFADQAFSFLWKRVEKALIEESLPLDEQLQEKPVQSDQPKSHPDSRQNVVTESAGRTASDVENLPDQVITQPSSGEGYLTSNENSLAPSFQYTAETDLDDTMQGTESDVWPFLQRIFEPSNGVCAPMDVQSGSESQVDVEEMTSSLRPLAQTFQSIMPVNINGAVPDQTNSDVWPFMQRIFEPPNSVYGPTDIQSAADSQIHAEEPRSSLHPSMQPLQDGMEAYGTMPSQTDGDVWPFMQRIFEPPNSVYGPTDIQSAADSQIHAEEPRSSLHSTAQPLQNGMEAYGTMPSQMADEVWPFTQRIRAQNNTDLDQTMIMDHSQFDHDSASQYRSPDQPDAQLRGSHSYSPCSPRLWEAAQRDCSQQLDLLSNISGGSSATPGYQQWLYEQYPVPRCGLDQHPYNRRCGNYHYIAPATAQEA